VLIIAPTRELAEQIHQAAVVLGRHTKIRSAAIYGGVGKGPQLSALQRGTEIIVACPGRLLDHIHAGDVDLSHIEVLVLDEADRMLDMGFLPDIRRILKHVPPSADDALLGHHAARHSLIGRQHPDRPGYGAGRTPGQDRLPRLYPSR
jgi:superfamily II DNA/RNA helicase